MMKNAIGLDLTYPVQAQIRNGPNLWLVELQNADISIVRTHPTRSLTPYSQRDPRWRHEIYAGGLTFAKAGCYTVAVAIILSQRYDDTPPQVADKLREAGAYTGPLLDHPERIPDAYPQFAYYGSPRWHDIPADVNRLRIALENGPVIAEADFQPGGTFNQHFFVVEDFTPDDQDLVIIDPWDGAYTRLMERYALQHWSLARALYGLRLLHPKHHEPECPI